ncbi:site-specific DNA-methyltransferase [Staphylococcus epidermidis]|nr:site-specific DNA-methyltransferase [Staphylococcus epidermidis]MBF9278504.1 site-specific DNA-methyltransferase [Staphylococcus epidermidis]MBF9307739.1 site-specific DNA-methyltransferase [Staphylococcus epidermidis]TES29245.1 site-specific DNA-methyltransferase [Staphylococcus epidermidis]
MENNYINSILQGDCIEKLKLIESNSIDLIFADPPYNMQIQGELTRVNGSSFNGVSNESWDKFDSIKAYKDFCRKWLIECQRILKSKNSSIWIIGSYQNIHIIGDLLQELGFWLINDIIWKKSNPTPNFRGTKFTNAQETLLWATPSKKTKYTFNYKTMKNINNGKQMTSIWKIPVASGSERLKDVEGNKLHQTQKPEKLLYNIIISSTKKGDTILDPFLGTGTTATISKKLGRNYIGIEQDKKYIHYAEQRIKNQVVIDDDYVNAVFDKKLIRVPFKKLVEEGFIDKNEYIYFNNTEEYAVISDDKELLYNGKHYSIHSLAGILKGLERANGWNYWYVKRNNKYISIDHYRNLYREKYSK